MKQLNGRKSKNSILTIVLVFVSVFSFSQIKVACVGNSITFGSGIEGRDSLAYPQQLGRILGQDWEVRNYGHSGATALKNGNRPYSKLPEYKQVPEYEPDVVILLLGTNDSKPDNWDNHKSEFKSDYEDLVDYFSNLNSQPLVMAGIPVPVIEDQWGITKEVTEGDITEIIRQVAEEKNLTIINFYSNLKSKDYVFPDKIHPNAEGAKIMAIQAALILLRNKDIIINRELK